MDGSRKYGTQYRDFRTDHLNRYRFAAEYLQGGVVLDAACGCGYGARILDEMGYTVTGADIEPEAIAWAKEYFGGPDFAVCDIEKMLPVGEYDSVVSFETLEHLQHPDAALTNFRLVAKRLIASVPNEEVWPFEADHFSDDAYPHQRHYTPQQFESLLTSCGWDVVDRFTQINNRKPDTAVIDGTHGRFLIYVCS